MERTQCLKPFLQSVFHTDSTTTMTKTGLLFSYSKLRSNYIIKLIFINGCLFSEDKPSLSCFSSIPRSTLDNVLRAINFMSQTKSLLYREISPMLNLLLKSQLPPPPPLLTGRLSLPHSRIAISQWPPHTTEHSPSHLMNGELCELKFFVIIAPVQRVVIFSHILKAVIWLSIT